jgi:hypothetical protein
VDAVGDPPKASRERLVQQGNKKNKSDKRSWDTRGQGYLIRSPDAPSVDYAFDSSCVFVYDPGAKSKLFNQ